MEQKCAKSQIFYKKLAKNLFIQKNLLTFAPAFETEEHWRDGRVVDYSSLENYRAERHRGFESLSLRNERQAFAWRFLFCGYEPGSHVLLVASLGKSAPSGRYFPPSRHKCHREGRPHLKQASLVIDCLELLYIRTRIVSFKYLRAYL